MKSILRALLVFATITTLSCKDSDHQDTTTKAPNSEHLYSPKVPLRAACSAVADVGCATAFNGAWAFGVGGMRAAKDRGVFRDQGDSEEVGRDVGRLGIVLSTAAGAPVAGALVASHCGECLCRDIY